MDGYRPSTYGDGFADVYDDWYADVSPPGATATFVATRTDGPVIELGSGTGRLAGPLREAGLPVVGVDASLAMLARSRSRVPSVPVAAADMAEIPVRHGSAGAVLVAFNTFFNLPTTSLQRRCLTEARALLTPGGIVIVETFVPGALPSGPADHVELARLDADGVVLRVSRTDPAERTVSGHHVELRDGEPVRLRPWHLHFTDPAGLDRIAASAGLSLRERYADWAGAPFDVDCDTQVSVFGAAEGPR
ncbi:MAG: class I SAM-dependent methyltransferase [Acidimicrobiales bacterium]|nr:class I SAM-dependent methyltransferase [Acidimicrobiales bacterium]